MPTDDDEQRAMLSAYDSWLPTHHGQYLGAAFEAGWAAGREYERMVAYRRPDRQAKTVERLRTALAVVHHYGLRVSGETESAHLWEEVVSIAEAALWPETVTDLADDAPKDVPHEPADSTP